MTTAFLDGPQRRRAESLPVAALLVAIGALGPFGVDMLVPSLPSLSREMQASSGTMQLAVTLWVVAFATSQLFYGPTSDRIGRRPVLLAGLSLFTLGGIICLLAPSAPVLLAGRAVEGFGGGVGPAIAQAIVVDVWGRGRAARVLALMNIAMPLAPAVSPIIGGFLQDLFGWHAVFIALAGLGVTLAVLAMVMIPESNPRHRRTVGDSRGLLADYRTVFSSRTFVGFALVQGLMFTGQLLFISASSYVLIDQLGLSARAYGFAFAFSATGLMAGAVLSSRLVQRMSLQAVVRTGTIGAASSALLMLALVETGHVSVLTVLIPEFLVGTGFGMARPAAIAGAIIPFPQMAGLASSMLLFNQQTLATGLNIVYGLLVPAGAVALARGISAADLVAVVAVVFVLRLPVAVPRPHAAHAGAGDEGGG